MLPKIAIRRCFRFGLRALLLAVTVVGLVLGWQTHVVRERRAARETIRRNGGLVICWAPEQRFIPGQGLVWERPEVDVAVWRRWLGDAPVRFVVVRRNGDIAWARRLFPEADASAWEL